jgi:hypothetical protein
MRTIGLILLAHLLLAGDGGGGGDDDGIGDNLLFEDIDDVASTTICAKIFECCDATERMEEFGLFTPVPQNEAECVTAYKGIYAAFLPMMQARIDAGTVVYHGDKAAQCMNAVAAASCAAWGGSQNIDATDPSCEQTFSGTVANGTACTDSEECADGSCDGDPGMCTAFVAMGQSCLGGTCADGLYCKYNENGTAVCTTQEANGTACSDNGTCASDFCDIPMGMVGGVCADAAPYCDGV